VIGHSWSGRVFYMKYGHPLDKYTDIALTLDNLELKLADFPLNLKHL